MRAVLVNHCHPETPHVCAVRAREFAGALARRGHDIVLLTETLHPGDVAEPPSSVRDRIRGRTPGEPLRIACRPEGHALLRRMREGRLPAPLSKAVAATSYLVRWSVFPDWGAGAARYRDVIAGTFAPDVVWATFGNTEALHIARALSERCGCPWVLDVKDYWSTFVPAPFRHRLGRRFSDAAAMTALSRGHLKDIAPFVPGPGTVVYSGIPRSLAEGSRAPVSANTIMIVGAIYDRRALADLVDGIARWSAGRATLRYAGGQGDAVAQAVAAAGNALRFEDLGYLPLDDLHRRQCTAFANAFVRSGPGWFQHKVPELIAAGRPILCMPGAGEESAGMARSAGIPFFNCASAAEVDAALRSVDARAELRPKPGALDRFTWDRRAEDLERVLLSAIG